MISVPAQPKRTDKIEPFSSKTLRNLALCTKGTGRTHPHLRTVWSYPLLFLLNHIPYEAQEEYATQVLTMLHKVDPNPNLKLRPINVGTNPRRCAAGLTVKHNGPRFAEQLPP